MEEIAWKRYETPYLVFPCEKCNQYTYTKTTRKTKKCARCRHLNIIEKVRSNGEVVNGISIAVEVVKLRQNEFAIEELGTLPEFRTVDDFKITTSSQNESFLIEEDKEEEYYTKFILGLQELHELYEKFPIYMIELIAEKYNIPGPEIKLLIRTFQKERKLIRTDGNLYMLNRN